MSTGTMVGVGTIVLMFTSTALAQGEHPWTATIDLAAVQAAPAMVQGEERAADPFTKGSWTLQTYGSFSFKDEGKGRIYAGHVGVGYYLEDDFSINFEALGAAVDATLDDDGGAGGLDLVLRWHFWHRDRLTFFLDTAMGIQQATTEFPSDSHFNFRLMSGFGATLRLDDSLYPMSGIRYLHISNAGTSEVNDGLDAGMAYLGLMIPF